MVKRHLGFLLLFAPVHFLFLALAQLLVVGRRAPAVRVVHFGRVVGAHLVDAAVRDQLLVDARVPEVFARLDRRVHVLAIAQLALVQPRDFVLQRLRAAARRLRRQEQPVRAVVQQAPVERHRGLWPHRGARLSRPPDVGQKVADGVFVGDDHILAEVVVVFFGAGVWSLGGSRPGAGWTSKGRGS
uniref:Putative secreted protein n=1 Tax=Ixodes ricinus TaxID=34613 RepID=A0A6B0UZP3_IXORI